MNAGPRSTIKARPLADLLGDAGLSQRGAAKALGINERTMRRYCSGDAAVPRVIVLALERLRDTRRDRESPAA
jgi:hypothetical protein